MSTPGQQDPLIGKVLADRFAEILSRIGEGGTGVVYKAKQITVDRTVAIKGARRACVVGPAVGQTIPQRSACRPRSTIRTPSG